MRRSTSRPSCFVESIDLLLLDTEGHDYTILDEVLTHGRLPTVIHN